MICSSYTLDVLQELIVVSFVFCVVVFPYFMIVVVNGDLFVSYLYCPAVGLLPYLFHSQVFVKPFLIALPMPVVPVKSGVPVFLHKLILFFLSVASMCTCLCALKMILQSHASFVFPFVFLALFIS